MLDNKDNKKIFLFLILVLLSVIFFFLDKNNNLNWAKKVIERVLNPGRAKVWQWRSKSQTSFDQRKLEGLERENTSLRTELHSLKQENASMRKMLGAPIPADWDFVPARVLGTDNQELIIDKGFEDKLEEEEIVVFEKVLIGKISKTNPYLSRVILPTKAGNSISAQVLETGSRGEVKVSESNDKFLILENVLQEQEIEEDQKVLTSGEKGIYPADLIIGEVVKIEKQEEEIYKKATVKPSADYKTLTNVFVVKKS